jgi:hypothetical protein
MSSQPIAHETGLERKRVLRALTIVRRAIAGQQQSAMRRTGAHTMNTLNGATHHTNGLSRPVIGLAMAHGRAFAETVPEPIAEEIRRAVRERTHPDTIVGSRHRYNAIVYRGRFIRLSSAGQAFGELEAFWAFLRQRLRPKGGIRRDRLGLYLAEYAWRYNRRAFSSAEQVDELLTLLHRSLRG